MRVGQRLLSFDLTVAQKSHCQMFPLQLDKGTGTAPMRTHNVPLLT